METGKKHPLLLGSFHRVARRFAIRNLTVAAQKEKLAPGLSLDSWRSRDCLAWDVKDGPRGGTVKRKRAGNCGRQH